MSVGPFKNDTPKGVMATSVAMETIETNYSYTKTVHFIEVLSLESSSGCQTLSDGTKRTSKSCTLGVGCHYDILGVSFLNGPTNTLSVSLTFRFNSVGRTLAVTMKNISRDKEEYQL